MADDLLTPIAAPEPQQPAPEPAAEAPKQEGEAAAPQAESEPPPPAADVEIKKTLRGVQKRIDEAIRDKQQAIDEGQRQISYWQQVAAAQQAQLNSARQQQQPPQFENYNGDLNKWTSDVARYEAEKVAANVAAQERDRYMREQSAYMQAQQQRALELQRAEIVKQRLDAAIKKYPDFMDVIGNPELPSIINQPAFAAVMESDRSAEIMYYLGKNPAKAHQLLSLSETGQKKEIGRIEAMLEAGKATSGAPAPVPTVSGNASNVRRSIADPNLPYEQYVQMRRDSRRKH